MGKLNSLSWPRRRPSYAVACALGRAGGNVLVNYVTDELAAEMVAEEIPDVDPLWVN